MVFSVPIIIITAIAGFKDMVSNTYPLACFLVFWLHLKLSSLPIRSS